MLKDLDKKELIFWGSILLLCTLKITVGDVSFYDKLFLVRISSTEASDSILGVYNWERWSYHFFSTFVLFAVIPAIIVKTVLKKSLKDVGICLGDWKFGLSAFIILCIVAAYPVYNSSFSEEHMAFYPLTTLATKTPLLFFLWSLTYLPHYIGWELFFRGYIGFESKSRYGTVVATAIPTLLTTLMHIGKPSGELWGALILGIIMSAITFRSRSILWILLFHWYLGILNSYFCGVA
ncbi:MAG: CPBP family intramembrane metalloprotease [Flavobacteriales bacterium]|nr:CPBP family intramembrane metalloprotease [Flavobacteriales bacterium]